MNAVITLVAAFVVIAAHIWLCHRRPKFWYLGGIIPLLWIALLIFLFFNGKINLGEDWKMIVFPTLIFFLLWAQGHLAAKKKEMEKMKAQDM